jgi:(1->4)-alpha-D-glucan 1-alpha-D-glucosylmutase
MKGRPRGPERADRAFGEDAETARRGNRYAMTDADNLDTLAALGGIEPGFWDIFGAFRETTPDAKRAILAAMGFDVSSPSAIAEACRETRERPWRDPLGPVQVIRRNGSLRAGVALPADYDGVVRWLISLESGEQRSGESPAM